MISVIERASSVREPAHDDAVAADDLLAIDAEVLARLQWSARDGESPGDERTRVVRPAGLHRQPAEVDVFALEHHFLRRRAGHAFRRHVEQLLPDRKLVPQVAQPFRRLWLAQQASMRPTSRSALSPRRRPSPPRRGARCRRDWRARESRGPSAARRAAPGRRRAAPGRRSRSSPAAARLRRRIRLRSPVASSCDTKLLKSEYFIALAASGAR